MKLGRKSVLLFFTFCIVFGVAFSGFAFLGVAVAQPPWLSGFSHRTVFHVSGGTPANASAGVQLSFVVRNDTGGIQNQVFKIPNETLPDFRDVRVTLIDGTTVLPLWNQSTIFGIECTLWCLFPALDTDYFLYWGNPAADLVWDVDQVFFGVFSNAVLATPLDEPLSARPVGDYSGYGNNGTAVNTTIVSHPVYPDKTARKFNGIDSYVTFADKVSLRAVNVTFSFDVVFDAISHNARVCGKADGYSAPANGGWSFTLLSPGGYEFWWGTGESDGYNRDFLAGSGVLSVGVPYHITLILTPTRCAVYVQNLVTGDLYVNEKVPLPASVYAGSSGYALMLGRSSISPFFSGVLSNVLFLDGAVSASEVMALSFYPDPYLSSGVVVLRNYVFPLPEFSQGITPTPSPPPATPPPKNPVLSISRPQNMTYVTSTVSVHVLVENADAVWFNVRNGSGWVFPYNFSYGGPTSVVGLSDGVYVFHVFAANSKGGYATASIMFSVDSQAGAQLPELNHSLLWIFLFEGNFLGFLQAYFVHTFFNVQVAFALIILLFMVPIYLRTKSLLLLCILWILLGSFFIVSLPLASGIAIVFIVLGVGGLFYKLFRKDT